MTASIPAAWTASEPRPIEPASAMTGLPAALARRPTSAGILPRGVWKSTAPSAVMTRSARAIWASRSTPHRSASMRTSKREHSRAPSPAASPAPRPPEAPVPGPVSRSRWAAWAGKASARSSAQWTRPASSASTCSGLAPFCGPKTRDMPRSPVRRLCMLPATRTSTSRRRGSMPEVSIRWTWARLEPIGSTSWPSASRSRAPRATSAPAPPSQVPESPQPMMMRRAPPSSATEMSSPTPVVVVAPGSRIPAGTRRRPAAAAISTNQVPWAEPPRRAR